MRSLLRIALVLSLPAMLPGGEGMAQETSFETVNSEATNNLTADVTAWRASDEDLKDLGFDWMFRRRQAGDNGVRVEGLLLPKQFAVVERALTAKKIEKLTPVIIVPLTTELQVNSPWDPKRRALDLVLKKNGEDDVEVSLKGVELPEPVSISLRMTNVLVLDLPPDQHGLRELYFVGLRRYTSAPAPPLDGKLQIQIEAKVVEIPESVFTKNQAELEDAMRNGDLKCLDGFQGQGLELASLPKIAFGKGQTGAISIVREFRFPTAFENDAAEKVTPTTFETASLGIVLELAPVSVDDGIQVKGTLTVRNFQGFTRSEHGQFSPAFQATEAHFLQLLHGGFSGFWLSGTRSIYKSSDSLNGMLALSLPEKIEPPSERGQLCKLGLVLSARLVPPAPVFPASAQLEVKAYDVTNTEISRTFLAGRAYADPMYSLATTLDKKDPIPAGATEFPVEEKSPGEFHFKTPLGGGFEVKRLRDGTTADISTWEPKAADGEKIMSTTTITFLDGSKVLLVSPKGAKREAILIVFQQKSKAP